MSDKITIIYENGRGKKVQRAVNQIIDVRDYVGTPGYAMLVVAANANLSVADILRFFETEDVGRSRSWIGRRRWMFQPPGTFNPSGTKPNQDGKDDWAVEVMRDNPTVSVRMLAHLLQEAGIGRSREWVRQHRCD